MISSLHDGYGLRVGDLSDIKLESGEVSGARIIQGLREAIVMTSEMDAAALGGGGEISLVDRDRTVLRMSESGPDLVVVMEAAWAMETPSFILNNELASSLILALQQWLATKERLG